MYNNRYPLRTAAHSALKAKGYTDIEIIRGSGGARLTCRKNGALLHVMVRTSADRWMGWMRTDTGEWRGLGDADLVVVATTAGVAKADVYALTPSTVRGALDANLQARLKNSPNLSATAPIFVSIDPAPEGRPSSVGGDLAGRAEWAFTASLSDEPPPSETPVPDAPVTGHHSGFADQVRREFAKLVGVLPQQVVVTFEVRL